MLRRLLSLALSALLPTVGARAAELWPGEFELTETYVGEGSVERDTQRRVADFEENNTLLHLVFTPRIKLGVLRLGVEYERFGFGLSERAALPDQLQSLAAVVGLDTQLSDSILVRVEAQPGFYGQEIRSNDFNVPFLLGGTYIYSPDLQLVLGVGVNVENKYPVLPGGGVRWKIAPGWVLNAVLPTPRLEYAWNRNLTAYLGANIKEANFRVNENFGTVRGRPHLNHAELSYNEIRTGAGIDWKIADWLALNLEGGYLPYRTFDFYRADIRYHQDGGAPYGMISFHGAF